MDSSDVLAVPNVWKDPRVWSFEEKKASSSSTGIRIDYRQFPYALKDCFDTLKWVQWIIAQVLSFSVTCHPNFFPGEAYKMGSYQQNCNDSVVTAARMEWFDWRCSPLLAQSLKNLPPALIITAECDIPPDEIIVYAEKSQLDGVDTYLRMLHTHPQPIDCYKRIVEFVMKVSD
ncbi:hypothetical protein M441DRAFT_65665 [Trichoderma asperellum CBS 433.97]|uniref:Alpha/beta hydrolase fold-3 domain-containing protein n=1 Tax=Trichoderma asperellum (strain ATCC 204424 / CBS 433.97 / NBRC 101777) TaxID=1042311 RepID=A0A2T3ZGE5_TRIA4|nr:hypothetical protein M441DRAFT_65665 [Trichoderma asperellum CBS 433.97]PTB43877.1 hypothetical protein M441DRAFT_65665 [Trichoderma asperellum CBS 433.97]